jgi:tripartite-type tricarboxylate transporter receptor subunit TctC
MRPRSNACAVSAFAVSAFVALGLATCSAAAETRDEISRFYQTHQITITVGYTAGSGYDMVARTVARHLSHHIPGTPSIVVVNEPGAGSLVAANRLYNLGRPDGTEIAIFGRSIFMEPLMGNAQAKFDAARFSWIGSAAGEMSVCVAWHQSKIKTWNDLLDNTFVAGANSPGSDTWVIANMINQLFGAKIKIVAGYPGGAEITRAIESGEVDGRCGWSWSALVSTKSSWLNEKMINVLVQFATESRPELKEAPLIMDFAKTATQRQIVGLVLRRQDIAWPFAAPPGMPQDRLQIMRDAFDATTRDPDYLTDAAKLGLESTPTPGAAVEKIVREVYQISPDVIAVAKSILSP